MRNLPADLRVLSVVRDLEGLDLGDARLEARARRLAERIQLAPARSFPRMCHDDAELEALYRFFANPAVTAEALFAPHAAATAKRCEQHQRVFVSHDTTELRFSGDREGMARLSKGGKGLRLHASMAISSEGVPRPLGLLAFQIFYPAPRGIGLPKAKAKNLHHSMPREEKTSSRWEACAERCEAEVHAEVELIHLADQEADDFTFLGELSRKGRHFIVRGDPARRVVGPEVEEVRQRTPRQPAWEFAFANPVLLRRQVRLAKRPERVNNRKMMRNRHLPVREQRWAELEVRSARVVFPRARNAQTEAKQVPVWMVWVHEPAPPPGEQAVEWMLWTSERAETAEEVAFVVDGYRARWLIEEYFQALKTGCNVQGRQLTHADRLEPMLALFMPIAWRLLELRHLAREEQDEPAKPNFNPGRLELLRVLSQRVPLSNSPTNREVYLAIAGLGGHLMRNGEPGWKTLAAGYTDLLQAEVGWLAARSKM